MSELLKGWYVDSSPGGGAKPLAKCGALGASIGIAGTSTVSYVPGTLPTLAEPGDTIPAKSAGSSTSPISHLTSTQIFLALAAATHLDGTQSARDLATTAFGSLSNSTSFSASLWVPWSDVLEWVNTMGNSGPIMTSPNRIPDLDAATAGTYSFFRVLNGGGNALVVLQLQKDVVTHIDTNFGASSRTSVYFQVNDTIDPSDVYPQNIAVSNLPTEDEAFSTTPWAHLMLSFDGSTSPPTLQFVVDDVVLYNAGVDQFGSVNVVGTSSAYKGVWIGAGSIGDIVSDRPDGDIVPTTYYKSLVNANSFALSNAAKWQNLGTVNPPSLPQSFTIPFSTADDTADTGNSWGLFGDVTNPTSGNADAGMIASLAEVWIAPGQLIDWSLHANRYKFHVSNDFGTVFAPCSLGPTGSRPTGVKPKFYLRGAPPQFRQNMANSSALLTIQGGPLLISDDPPPEYA